MDPSPSFQTNSAGRFFLKMQGLRNHFVVVDARRDAFSPSVEEIVRICDPEIGVGADQLLIVEHAEGTDAAAFMRILNVDGREVEACGNATRCVAWLLMQETGRDQLGVETLAGVLSCRKTGEKLLRCDMGMIKTGWQHIPLSEDRDTSAIDLGIASLPAAMAFNIGNPHLVYFVDDIDAVDVTSVAPAIQRHALFPQSINVGFAEVLSDGHLRVVVYERGAGLTQACGSGACVAAHAARVRGLASGSKLTVSMPAGDVEVTLSDDGRAAMEGPVDYCYSGFLPE